MVCKCGHCHGPLKPGMAWCVAYQGDNEVCHYSNPQLSARKCDETRELPITWLLSQKALVQFINNNNFRKITGMHTNFTTLQVMINGKNHKIQTILAVDPNDNDI